MKVNEGGSKLMGLDQGKSGGPTVCREMNWKSMT